MKPGFTDAARRRFRFLVDEFGFRLIAVRESPRGEPWEGELQYASHAARVHPGCTRGEVPGLWLGRAKDGGQHLVPVHVLYEYRHLSADEKKVVLSASGGRQAARILAERQPGRSVAGAATGAQRNTLLLTSYAACLREAGLPFLAGDFSEWLPLWEYHTGRLIAEHVRAGRPLDVPLVVSGPDGQLRVAGKEHVFREALEYIQQLKDEQGRRCPPGGDVLL